ncbi:MAG: nucleotide pyrophosphohydrolase [Candidatus Colwellbacteria bacterium RBG_13_48_8]|uniref:Nucleotide pyrophosphohydrolase n=1 Tax=Candidatus Colwellbacteria bacterium RBG_13_48_8 TaxID=1797685 RepID=A0A1G1YWD4_9BACT|nr:MAG: nucleotide pyrophosphohydrolase [Candidatus Colwellbacteria bacterium RBG_13_48_8]
MEKYQKELDEWFKERGWEYWKPHEIIAQLFEEGGELARLINHLYGPKKKKPEEAKQELEGEIGDVMYALICLANSQGINLDDAIRKSFDKVAKRDKDRF